jgi:HEAT repeat protein
MIPVRVEVSRLLPELFEAERSVRRLHAELAKADPPALLEAIDAAVREALDLGDEDEGALRLVRLASLLGELEGPRAVDVLIDILGSEEPEARHTAGEVLEDLAFDRFKEVALGVERALERLPSGNSALLELPYLLGGIGEPGVRKLLGRFLAHEDPEAVAAAIEVLVDMGDTGAAALIAPLERDTREVSLEDEEGEEGTSTIGELATEAKKLLAEIAGAREPISGAAPRARTEDGKPQAKGGRPR